MMTSANIDTSYAGSSYPLPDDYSQNNGSGGAGDDDRKTLMSDIERLLRDVLSFVYGGGGGGNDGGGDGVSGGNDDGMQTGGYGDHMQAGCNCQARGRVGDEETQDQAGVLSSYMSEHHIKAMTVGKLYQLAENPDVPPAVSEAAKYFMDNPDEYKRVETHDVAGVDGKAGVNDMQWAAQGFPNEEGPVYGLMGG